MKQYSKRFFPMYFRVVILVAGVFFGMLVLNVVRDRYSEAISREKDELLSLSSLFNDIAVETDTCRSLVLYLGNASLQASSTFSEEEYTLASESLRRSSVSLAQRMNENGYNRSSIDLMYMVETYLENAEMVVTAASTRNYTTMDAYNQRCEKVYRFLQAQMSMVHRELQRNHQISTAQLTRYNTVISYLSNLTFGVILGFGVLLIYLLNRVILRPIHTLTQTTRQFSLQSTQLRPTVQEVHARSEIDVLNNTLYHMQQRICEQYHLAVEKAELEQQLEAEKRKAAEHEKLIKEAELKSLQARINPHFLFNSINLISKMAYIEEAQQTMAMMESLGELLRYNLDNFSRDVTLEKELDNLKDYVAIQKIRFGTRIQFNIQTDANVEKARIPSLVLQPLVENAIIHGVGKYTDNALVCVEVRALPEERVEIMVLDNGVGMDAQALSELRTKIQAGNATPEDTSIGLSNVWKRLQIFFNDDVGIDIDAEKGSFFKIRIRIPLRLGQPSQEEPTMERG